MDLSVNLNERRLGNSGQPSTWPLPTATLIVPQPERSAKQVTAQFNATFVVP
jgi:hypothetical protein